MSIDETSETALAHKKAASLGPLAYTIGGAVAASGRSRTGVYAAIKSGALVARKDQGRTVILARDLVAWLEALPRLVTRKAA